MGWGRGTLDHYNGMSYNNCGRRKRGVKFELCVCRGGGNGNSAPTTVNGKCLTVVVLVQ